jgi:prepilin-type N-terminal cleavage/methylation domain-containing protein/prepilin-type processing-associated H-X9-DG protein
MTNSSTASIPNRRRGFTLIELLVVIAIIAVLIGLLLPAVQKVRESAARAKCQNNLKQIGLGVHNFENTNGYLPPSGTTIGGAKGHSALTYLLPYIELNQVYNQIDINKPLYDPVNMKPPFGTNTSNPFGTTISIFICPTTPEHDGDYGKVGYLNVAPGIAIFGTTDYGVLDGIGAAFATIAGVNQSGHTGLMQFATLASGKLDTRVRFTDCPDGTSSTVVFAEDAGRTARWDMNSLVPGSPGASPGQRSEAAWGDYDVEYFTHGSDLDGSGGSCFANCTNDNEMYSFHTQGVNVVMADGHVFFLRKSATPFVVAAMISRAGGEAFTLEP